MKALLSGVALAAGIGFALIGPVKATPAQSTLPALEALTHSDGVTQVRRRCRSFCVRKRMGICTKWRNRCWNR
jgi:hypothetical protein